MIDPWLGFLLAAGTPGDVVARLNAATEKVLALPAVRERFAPQALSGARARNHAELTRPTRCV